MLIPEIHAVAGKMLEGGSHMVRANPFHVAFCHPDHLFRVRAKGAHIGNGAQKVIIEVDNRRE